MNQKLKNSKTKEIKNQKALTNFMWRTRTGELLSPSQMATRHVFYTLRMIWNHTAPEPLKIRPYQKYKFGPTYTTEYMIKAVRALISELKKRKDIEIYMPDLLKMERNISAFMERDLICEQIAYNDDTI